MVAAKTWKLQAGQLLLGEEASLKAEVWQLLFQRASGAQLLQALSPQACWLRLLQWQQQQKSQLQVALALHTKSNTL